MTVSLPLHIRQNLRNLGFSDNDILILSYLFHIKKATLKDVSRQTAISYSTTQYVTANLVSLGILAVSMEQNEEYYTVCSQDEFLDWIDERRIEVVDQYKSARQEMKHFLQMVQGNSWQPELTYYEGVEGIKAIYEDMLNEGQDICAWTDISLIEKTLGDFMTDYITRRVELGIKSQSILPKNKVNMAYSKKEQKRETKIVSHLDIKGEIRIYGEKVAVITFDKKRPVGYVIHSPVTANMYRSIFEYSWAKED